MKKPKTMNDYIEMQKKEVARIAEAIDKHEAKIKERWPEEMYGLKWLDKTKAPEMEKELKYAMKLLDYMEGTKEIMDERGVTIDAFN